MKIFDKIWKGILTLFGKHSVDGRMEGKNTEFRDTYENTDKVSFTAIIAGALANKSVSDSSFNVTDSVGQNTRRSEWIQSGLDIVWKNIARECTQELGKGGKVLVPYVSDGKPYVDSIDQSRMRITAMQGDEITGATLMADVQWLHGRQHFRWVDYALEGHTHIIRNRATNAQGGEIMLSEVPAWAEIQPEILIDNVDHLLLAYLKSPADNREDGQMYGVPVTYGAEDTIRQLHGCIAEMEREYRIKKAFVGADERLFGKNQQLPDSGLFRKMMGTNLDGKSFWEVFDPAIRDSAYLSRFEHLCGLLEREVGVSPGILTKPETVAATATEIRAANDGTFAYISAIRASVETAFAQLAYALDVLAEYTGATPAGARTDYAITWDWDMSMKESSTETFTQMSELESRGLLLPERLVSWVTGMDMDAAKEEVQEAQKRQQTPIDSLLTEE